MEEKRVGQIATDENSGPNGHFLFSVPVEAGRNYLVKVEGTDGYYTLEYDIRSGDALSHDQYGPVSGNILAPASTLHCLIVQIHATTNDAFEICSTSATGSLQIDRYLLNLADIRDPDRALKSKARRADNRCRWDALWAGRYGDCRGR